MNNITLVGRMTKNPELKYGQSGKAYIKFSLAVNRPFKKDECDFINCCAFNKTAELIGEYLTKGSQLGVLGAMQQNQYEKDGVKHNTYEVIVNQIEFLGGGDKKNNNSSKTGNNKPKSELKQENCSESDDEFPF
jgi:single-strand DNA-binding protein